ncbi:MAG: hypothetical protein JRJ45_00080 [Deltaproteobacteria bacterium]|nr:hypothetical protein [Deltaproteobacteria bacterium]
MNPAAGKKNYEIIWEDGVPRAVIPQPKFDKGNAANLLAELSVLNLNFPYEGSDPKYFGMTKGEAIAAQFVDAAANGDAAAIKELMDRVMGKPQQNIKSVSVKGTLGEFLDTLDTSEADVIDI